MELDVAEGLASTGERQLLLGGTVGIGTVVFAFGVGPLIGLMLPRLSLEPLPDAGRPPSDAVATT